LPLSAITTNSPQSFAHACVALLLLLFIIFSLGDLREAPPGAGH